MPLSPDQAKFVVTLSHATGLNPRVVGAWALAEQSGSAAKYYEGKGYNDWLNIANTDSGPASGAHSSVWRDPVTAAKATAEWLKGSGQIAKEYGAPAQGIRNILDTAGRGPEQQIQSIAHSGWASSGYDGGATLRALYGEVSPKDLPNYTPGAEASSPTGSLGLPKINSTSGGTEAYEKSARDALANRMLFGGEKGGVLSGLLRESAPLGAATSATGELKPEARNTTASALGSLPNAPEPEGSGASMVNTPAHPLAKPPVDVTLPKPLKLPAVEQAKVALEQDTGKPVSVAGVAGASKKNPALLQNLMNKAYGRETGLGHKRVGGRNA